MKFKITLLIVVLFVVYGHWGDFLDPIRPIHEWRKTDSFAIALNYMNGNSFSQPETQFISDYNNRAAAGEFPLIYYIIGKVWAVFGQHEWIGKLLSYLILYSALILFSEVLQFFFRSEFKTMLFTATILSSPIILFYSNTILPNIYSFSFLLISAYLIYRYLIRPKGYHIILLTLFLSLAVMIKITALIAILTFSGAAIIHFGIVKKEIFTLYKRPALLLMLPLIAAMFFTWLWYSYAIRYNALHHSDLFSTVVRPIWEVNASDIKRIWTSIWKYQFNLTLHLSVLIPVTGLIIYGMIRKKITGFLFYLVALGFIGVLSYICLWFWALEVHDYYLIEILFFPLVLLFIICKDFDSYISSSLWVKRFSLYIFAAITFVHAFAYSQTSKGKSNFVTKNNIMLSSYIRGNWWYFNDHYKSHLSNLQRHVSELKNIIGSSDTVICITDPSPNIQLYTIGRFGFTRMGFNREMTDSAQVANLIERGADVILKVGQESTDTTANCFYADTLFQQDGIGVFDLKDFKPDYTH